MRWVILVICIACALFLFGGCETGVPSGEIEKSENSTGMKSEVWKAILRGHVLGGLTIEERQLEWGRPSLEGDLRKFESEMGCEFPPDFRDLYEELDGFGISEEDGVRWVLYPLDGIPMFQQEVESWYSATHPTLVGRFIPFFQFEWGDASGYLKDEKGRLMDGVYTFVKDRCEVDDDQDWREFLHRTDNSIEELLE